MKLLAILAFCAFNSIVIGQFGLPLNLTLPFDNDSLSDANPVFVWQTDLATILSEQRVTQQLVIVELQDNQSAAEGIATNSPVVFRSDLNNASYPLSTADYALKPGVWYAWQVSILIGDVITQQSDPWRFILPKQIKPLPNYVVLRRQEDASYFAFPEPVLYVASQEKGVLQLRGKISTPDGKSFPVQLRQMVGAKELTDVESTPSTETRYFKVDLTELGLKAGLYTFTWNAVRNQQYTLNFKLN